MSKEVNKYLTEVTLPMREIFKDMVKYTPSKIFGLLGNTVLVPVYTNLLTREEYGVYTVAIAVLSFLCIIFSDWVGLSGLRFFREHQLQNQISKYLSTLVLILSTNIVLMFLVAFFFRHQFYDFFDIPEKRFFAIVLLVIPTAVRALLFQILRAQIKPSAFTISTIINQILTILLSVFVIKTFHLGGVSILIGMALSISIIDVILIFQSNILKYFKIEPLSWNTLKSIFMYGLPIAIASISLWSITQSNKIIVQQLRGFSDAALIGVGYSLTFPILMTLFAIFTVAAYPRIINIYEDKKDVRPIISKITGYFLAIAIPLAVLASVYSKDIVDLLANEKFAEAYVLIPYLAFGCLFLSLAEYTTMQYLLVKKTYINTIIRIVAGLIGVGLNYLLILKMGIVGAGIATLFANFIYFSLSLIIVMPNLEWRIPFKKLKHIVISFIPMVLLYFIFHFLKSDIHPWVEMSTLLGIYLITFFVVSRLDKDRYII